MFLAVPGPSPVALPVPSPAKRDVLGTRRSDWATLACPATQAATTNTATRSHTSAPMPHPPCNRFIIRSASATGGAARNSLNGASAPDRETACRACSGLPEYLPLAMTEVTFVPKRDWRLPPMGSSPIQAQRGLREYATNAPVEGY